MSCSPAFLAPLHNQFILANIHNAQKEAPPPSTRSVGWAKGKKDKDGKLLKEKDPKRRKIKNQVMSLGKAERERIKSLKVKKGIHHRSRGVVCKGQVIRLMNVCVVHFNTGTSQEQWGC